MATVAAGEYTEALQSLQSSCDGVLGLLGAMEGQLGAALDAQSDLYEAYKRSQIDPKLPPSASTKDIIKALQSSQSI